MLIRKKDSDKKFRYEYESTTQKTWFKLLFSYFRFFAILDLIRKISDAYISVFDKKHINEIYVSNDENNV